MLSYQSIGKTLFFILFLWGSNYSLRAQANETSLPDTLTKEQLAYVVDTTNNPGLKRYLQYLQTEWDTTPQPLNATFRGFSMGDYPHLVFEDKEGVSYDFGDGANELGDYTDDFLIEADAKWIGKSFKVFWQWKRSSFYCCEGEMQVVETWIPSITQLILLDP